MVALLRPRVGEEDVDAGKRGRRNHRRHDFDGVVLHHAHVGEAALGDPLEQAAHARRVHVDGEEVDVGPRQRHRAVVSPMPNPMSSTRGARRPNTRSKSSGDGAKATPNAGHSVSSARCCAGDMRPCRSTKLRIGRCGAGASGTSRSEGMAGFAGAGREPALAASRRRRAHPIGIREAAREARPRRRRPASGVFEREGLGVLPRRDHVGPRRARPPARAPCARRRGSRATARPRSCIGARRNPRSRGETGRARAWDRPAARSCGRSSRWTSRNVASSPSVTYSTTALISLMKSQRLYERPPVSASTSVNVTVPDG